LEGGESCLPLERDGPFEVVDQIRDQLDSKTRELIVEGHLEEDVKNVVEVVSI